MDQLAYSDDEMDAIFENHGWDDMDSFFRRYPHIDYRKLGIEDILYFIGYDKLAGVYFIVQFEAGDWHDKSAYFTYRSYAKDELLSWLNLQLKRLGRHLPTSGDSFGRVQKRQLLSMYAAAILRLQTYEPPAAAVVPGTIMQMVRRAPANRYLKLSNGPYSSVGSYMAEIPSTLANVSIPAGTQAIAAGAFAGNISLLEIELPAGVTELGDGAFKDCTWLTSVRIPDGVVHWELCVRGMSLAEAY